jgi:alanine-synthesizing transaminase
MEEFYRIRRLPPYVFEQVNRAKAVARNGGADIIDLGMGNPDLPTPAHVVEKLKETVGKPRTDRYSASRGIAGLRRAQAAYYARRFGVKLNPETHCRAQPYLPDSRVRLPDGGRRDPLGPGRGQ